MMAMYSHQLDGVRVITVQYELQCGLHRFYEF